MTNYSELKTFQKSQVNGLTKALSALRFRSWSDDKNLETDIMFKAKQFGLKHERSDWHSGGEIFLFDKPRKITKEQTQLGKEWLKKHFFKLNGEVRSGKNTEHVGSRVIEISRKVTRFEFVGVVGLRNGFGQLIQFLPLYRTYSGKQYFDYAPIHWGQPVIIEGL